MSTVKANNYLQLLDTARCSGAWESVPELCRKVQKHAPGRRCLALASATEARLYLLRRSSSGSTPASTADKSTLLNLQESLLQELESCPPSLPNVPSPAGGGQVGVITLEDVLQARTVLAWIYSLRGEWGSALKVVPSEEELLGEWNGGVGKAEYFGVARIKALVLRGIALAHLKPDDPSLALQLYRAATRLPSTYPSSGRDSPSLLLWTEKALSHHALAAYCCWLEAHASQDPSRNHYTPTPDGDTEQPEAGLGNGSQVRTAIGKMVVNEATVAATFRGFHNFVAGIAQSQQATLGPPPAVEKGLTPEKEMERREVYRNYHKFLSLLLLPDGHPNKPTPRDLRQSTPGEGGTISIVSHNEPIGGVGAKAGTREQLKKELEAIGGVYEEYLLRGLAFPGAAEYHNIIGEWVDRVIENWLVSGGSGEDASAVVETLYKACTKSFHSPRILRHLFTALTATGNFPDALLALKTYVELIHKAKERISKGHVEKDFDDDKTILQTAVEGIRLVCIVTGDGEKAMTMAETLEKWIDEWDTRDPEVLSDVYRGIGMANATWARQTIDAERRPDAQLAAIKAFKKGLSYDTLDVDGWYGLALVQVEHGDIEPAVESSKRGLSCLKHLAADDEADEFWDGRGPYRRRAIPLLHLLAILMTVEEDFKAAERACENAFEILGDNMAVFRGMGVGEKEGVLEVKMTQIAIEEALNGPEAAVGMSANLLDLYGRLFEVTNVVGADLPTSTFQSVPAGSAPSTRPSTASRKSRLLGGRSHKKEFAASATNLSQDKSSFQQSGSDGNSSLTKRPKSGHQSLHQPTGTPNPNAPKIQITEHSSTRSANASKKQNRPKSVSGGTIRRMKSFGSLHSSGHSAKQAPEVPTPPLPSSTEASSVSAERSPVGSVKGHEHHHHPHLFHMLKMKLQKHQLQEMGSSNSSVVAAGQFAGSSTSFVPDGIRTPVDGTADGTADAVLDRSGLPRANDIPNNLEQSKLPHPISAVGSRITDELRGKGAEPRNTKRPASLPEPMLKEEDERKRAAGALRAVWIFVGGLYRRAGYLQDAAMAVEEAAGLVGTKGDGEADMLTQKALLALVEGKTELSAEFFDEALFVDVSHPLATVGLTNILLDISIEPNPSTLTVKEGALETTQKSEGDTLTVRNRAMGLLQQLTNSPRGWNVPEAWFALAKSYELAGELERAKSALWKCVTLEDCRGVRSWSSIRPRIV